VRDVRSMSKEECEAWMRELEESGVISDITEDHRLRLTALQNPTRRRILGALEERPKKLEELSQHLNIPSTQLKFHIEMLKSALYVELDGDLVDLTPRGVHYLRYR